MYQVTFNEAEAEIVKEMNAVLEKHSVAEGDEFLQIDRELRRLETAVSYLVANKFRKLPF
ncbi:MAG: hypothetical protein CMQ46_05140 [Gammaproteobacteria bacterium]|nr:hypothetical protein [Gammaproteobacteria bacterium]MBJ54633.1 hypothetical protein [Gammaproteobacteria bacterium]|tara:strand:+ start:3237 stop:3416 length:180 start_codon:yes stop_codon:yes gene_type:complete